MIKTQDKTLVPGDYLSLVSSMETFYGEGKVYEMKPPPTREEVAYGMLMTLLKVRHKWMGGDTVDREIVAKEIVNLREMNAKS